MRRDPTLLERWRRRVASLGGRPSDPAPPTGADATALRAARAGLDALRNRDAARFDASFLRGRPFRASRPERALLDALQALGVAERIAGALYAPRARLTRLQGRWIATDLPTYAREDQVFAIMFEQVYVLRNLDVRPGDELLELCAGSGVLSLFAADTARRVTGVELSPRALAFARFNLALAEATGRVELVEGSLYDPLPAGRRYDHVLVNPPFEPVPPGARWPLHSAAGEDGLDLVRQVLAGAADRLASGGRLSIVTWSPGDETAPLLAALVREALPTHGIRLDVLGREPLDPYLARFEASPGYGPWRERLAARGLTHLWFLFLHAAPAEASDVTLTWPTEEVRACHAVSDAWL